MSQFWKKVHVVLTAAPTVLAAVATAIGIFADEFIAFLPEAWGAQAAGIVVVVLAVLAAASRVVRRVTPVLPNERGILPRSES